MIKTETVTTYFCDYCGEVIPGIFGSHDKILYTTHNNNQWCVQLIVSKSTGGRLDLHAECHNKVLAGVGVRYDPQRK